MELFPLFHKLYVHTYIRIWSSPKAFSNLHVILKLILHSTVRAPCNFVVRVRFQTIFCADSFNRAERTHAR